MNGGSRLSAIHDLEVAEAAEQELRSVVCNVNLLGSRGDAVVVGEEHRWLVLERDPDAAVDLSVRLEKHPHVLLEEASSPAVVDFRQDLSGNDGEVRLMVGLGLLGGQNRESSSEILHQIDFDVFAAVACGGLCVEAPDVPDAIGGLSTLDVSSGPTVNAFAELAVADQQQANSG